MNILQRGTPEWEQRERDRQALGCKCISLGTVDAAAASERRSGYDSEVVRRDIRNARVMPTPTRAAELRARQSERMGKAS